EIARITNGYSPAMIEQICSMALTNAHHEGQTAFTWQHLVDAMTVIESGTAIGVKYTPRETRAVAIHEAGHATTAHAYRPEIESSRLSIRMRGGSLGHHQFFDRVAAAIDLLKEAHGALASLSEQPRGLLRVTAPVTFGRRRVAPLLPAFLQRHPHMQVQLVLLDRPADLAEEGFDVA